jgi:hypothetical protein
VAKLTITVSRSTILENRQSGRDDPAWVLTDTRDFSTRRVKSADFGAFRLIQKPVKQYGGICYIETDSEPLAVE